MNFIDYLLPVDENLNEQHLGQDTFGASISAHVHKLPDFDRADIALVGVLGWGTTVHGFRTGDLNFLRNVLYDYRPVNNTTHIVDMGDLKIAETHSAFLEQVTCVAKALLQEEVVPIFIGGSQDLDLAIYRAYQELDKKVSYASIDNRFDGGRLGEVALNNSYLSQLIEHDADYLEAFYQLGYQTYLVNDSVLKKFEKLQFETIRLGEVRQNIEAAEPLLRASDFISFDLSAVKKRDFSSSSNAHVFGFTAEEACQLMWYSGISEKSEVLSLTEFSNVTTTEDTQVLATLLWYFVEGYYNRQESMNFASENYTLFTVPLIDFDVTVDFVKSSRTNRWWFKCDEKYIPCNYTDYTETLGGEITSRVFKHILQ